MASSLGVSGKLDASDNLIRCGGYGRMLYARRHSDKRISGYVACRSPVNAGRSSGMMSRLRYREIALLPQAACFMWSASAATGAWDGAAPIGRERVLVLRGAKLPRAGAHLSRRRATQRSWAQWAQTSCKAMVFSVLGCARCRAAKPKCRPRGCFACEGRRLALC